MRPNAQFPADLVTFTKEICKGKLHFLCTAGTYLLKTVISKNSGNIQVNLCDAVPS